MKLTFATLTLALATARAGSITINLDATLNGCSSCNGTSNVYPGATLGTIYVPTVQLVLGAGTYTITNGDTTIGDKFSAWNFQGPVSTNWVWSFLAANDATHQVLMDDYIAGVYANQAAAAGATGIATFDGPSNELSTSTSTAAFTDTLVLASTTTVDFIIDDYFMGDNAGGVALTVTGPGIGNSTPEPSTFILLGAALLALGAYRGCQRCL